MYTVFAALTVAGCAGLTVFGMKSDAPDKIKKAFVLNLTLAALAALVAVFAPFLLHRQLFAGNYDEEWTAWAWDAFTLYLKTTAPVCLILLAGLCAAAILPTLTGQKNSAFFATVRQLSALASSALALFMAAFYSAMAETENAPVHICILIFGVCEALLFRLAAATELAVRTRSGKTSRRGRTP